MKVILRLSAKPDKVEELKRILIGLAAPTRKEPGCLTWEIFQNRADPCDFTFVEEWASDAALDAHWATPHVQDALARGVPLLAASPDDRRYVKDRVRTMPMNVQAQAAAERISQPFYGIVDNEGRVISNWGQHRTTRPAVYVEPISYRDVQAVVRDASRFPTPVNPVGSIASVTDTIVNDGGTMVCLRKLDDVLGLERDAKGRRVVRVQAGCRLKKLNMWLQAHGVEIPFQAEIGEATVGSVAVGDTKESSLDAPGYFSAHVVALSYVDDKGELRTLSDHADGAAFHAFKCSFGLSGIVVECQLEVRPATLCQSDISLAGFKSPDELVAGLIQARGACDALLAIVFLHHLASFFDQRRKAGPGDMTPASSQPICDEFRVAKRLAIQHGFEGVEVSQPKGLVYSRADFVNEYWRPTATERRLDFQYYEHDLSRMSAVVLASYRFVKEFEKDTGYAPNGWATYFVNRPEQAKKPFGLYSDGPGVSFSFDPFCSNPAEPRWQRFAAEYNKLAIHKLGGRASPIQTQWLKRGDVTIPRQLARPRFTTKYYEQFLD